MARAEVGSAGPRISTGINIGAARSGHESAVSLGPNISSTPQSLGRTEGSSRIPSGPRLTFSGNVRESRFGQPTTDTTNKLTVFSGFGLERPTDSSPVLNKAVFKQPGTSAVARTPTAYAEFGNSPTVPAPPRQKPEIKSVAESGIRTSRVNWNLPLLQAGELQTPTSIVYSTNASIDARPNTRILQVGMPFVQSPVSQSLVESPHVFLISSRMQTGHRESTNPFRRVEPMVVLAKKIDSVRQKLQKLDLQQTELIVQATKKVSANPTSEKVSEARPVSYKARNQGVEGGNSVVVQQPSTNTREAVSWIARRDLLIRDREDELRQTADQTNLVHLLQNKLQGGEQFFVQKKDDVIRFIITRTPHLKNIDLDKLLQRRKKRNRRVLPNEKVTQETQGVNVSEQSHPDLQRKPDAAKQARAVHVENRAVVATVVNQSQPQTEAADQTHAQQGNGERVIADFTRTTIPEAVELSSINETNRRFVVSLITETVKKPKATLFKFYKYAQDNRLGQWNRATQRVFSPFDSEYRVPLSTVVAALEAPNTDTASPLATEEGINDGQEYEWRSKVAGDNTPMTRIQAIITGIQAIIGIRPVKKESVETETKRKLEGVSEKDIELVFRDARAKDSALVV